MLSYAGFALRVLVHNRVGESLPVFSGFRLILRRRSLESFGKILKNEGILGF